MCSLARGLARSVATDVASPACFILHACLVLRDAAAPALKPHVACPLELRQEGVAAPRTLHAFLMPCEATLGKPFSLTYPGLAALFRLHATPVCSIATAACS